MTDLDVLFQMFRMNFGMRETRMMIIRQEPDVRQIVRQVAVDEARVEEFVRRKLDELEAMIRNDPHILEKLFDVEQLKQRLRLVARTKMALNDAMDPW